MCYKRVVFMEKYYLKDEFIGVESPRAYYIPFGDKTAVFKDREESDRFLSLDGTWNIEEYSSVLLVPDDFYLSAPKDTIDVPSCVQTKGYDKNQYTNVRYPFPFDPPFVPNENPAYHYKRTFDLKKREGEKYYLNFEGVDSCFYLFVNGKFVGFSQISHRISEFDITEFTVNGKNVLDVLVLKWCLGSYFEDQDKLRFTGIFRDVYLLTRPENHVTDYKIETFKDGTVTFSLLSGEKATVTFNGKEREVKCGETAVFFVPSPKLWSAETPYLYDLVICSNGEYIGEKVGIREVWTENGVFYFNGEPIKLCGVNRHDFNPINGATVSKENIIKDLTVMKELNVNAIRTSHYPSCPELYKLCDEYGFYVMSESDLECHGVSTHDDNREYMEQFDDFAKDEKYQKIFLDRQEVNVKVNKNRPCVFSWSLGNESGYGINFIKCYDFVKDLDKTRPVHYEHAHYIDFGKKRKSKAYYNSKVDMQSFMYLGYAEFIALILDRKEKRPFLLCEYCHAMGNSPGDLKFYWDRIRKSDRYMGGFVWEFKDHGLKIDGKERYGGDYGETLHDGNFCIDGITNSDCEITPKSLEMKKVYEPIEFLYSGGSLTIKSRLFFKTLDFTLSVTKKNGREIVEEKTYDVALPPKEEKIINIGDAGSVIVSATLKEDDGLNKKGFEFAREGFVREDNFTPEKAVPVIPKVTESAEYFTVSGGDTEIIISKLTGEICGAKKNGKDYLLTPMKFNIYRAPTDNDRIIRAKWERLNYQFAKSETRSIEKKEHGFIIKGVVGADSLLPVLNYTLEYVFIRGGVSVNVAYSLTDKDARIPAIGFYFAADKAFKDVEYYGYGPNESYVDKRLSAIKDYYKTTVDKMETGYLKPQENGSRYGTNLFTIKDGDRALKFTGEFSFSALPHSVEEYIKTPHAWELPESKATYIRIDGAMAGVGSNSCGPEMMKEFFPKENGKFGFTLTLE